MGERGERSLRLRGARGRLRLRGARGRLRLRFLPCAGGATLGVETLHAAIMLMRLASGQYAARSTSDLQKRRKMLPTSPGSDNTRDLQVLASGNLAAFFSFLRLIHACLVARQLSNILFLSSANCNLQQTADAVKGGSEKFFTQITE